MKAGSLLSALLAFAPAALAKNVAFGDKGNLPSSQIVYAEPEYPVLAKRASSTSTSASADAACTNSATSRNCWSSGYSIATDFDSKFPTTGVTRSYTLTMTNVTSCSLDGVKKSNCLLFNGAYPGPVITANWGDMLSITVVNKMTANGTSVHWHGIRQLGTNNMDGVNGVTECPLAPGQSETYTFQATQFGTSWYHSHFSSQYGDGLVGAIVINGPASSNYDIDLGPLPITDYYYTSAFGIDSLTDSLLQLESPGPAPDNFLVNGTNKNVAQTAGSYSKTKLTKGKKHLLRLINTSVDNPIRVSLDSHPFLVITSDFTPIQPIVQSSLFIAIGQRYEVIITANQTAAAYWFRVSAETACRAGNSNSNGGNAVFYYAGIAASTIPTSSQTYTDTGCVEPSPLTPWVSNTVGNSATFIKEATDFEINLDVQISTSGVVVAWGINSSEMMVQWDVPTLTYVAEGNSSFPTVANLIEIVNEDVWTFWIIQETNGADTDVVLPHPIHLHGHDFYVLGKGQGVFNMSSDASALTYTNPPRRDTSMLPGGGWMVIAWPSDNPGAWLLHCHIAWHISEGLGVQFLESVSTMPQTASGNTAAYTSQCAAWDKYYATSYWKQIGSGL